MTYYYYVVFDVYSESWIVTQERPAPWWPYHTHSVSAHNCAQRMNANEGRTWAL